MRWPEYVGEYQTHCCSLTNAQARWRLSLSLHTQRTCMHARIQPCTCAHTQTYGGMHNHKRIAGKVLRAPDGRRGRDGRRMGGREYSRMGERHENELWAHSCAYSVSWPLVRVPAPPVNTCFRYSSVPEDGQAQGNGVRHVLK